MSKINLQVIANTKAGVDAILEKLKDRSDGFIDMLVQMRPDAFTSDNSDNAVDPFIIVGLMNSELAKQFEEFKTQQKKESKPQIKKGSNDPTSH